MLIYNTYTIYILNNVYHNYILIYPNEYLLHICEYTCDGLYYYYLLYIIIDTINICTITIYYILTYNIYNILLYLYLTFLRDI